MTISATNLMLAARTRIGLNFQDGRVGEENPGYLNFLNAGLIEMSVEADWDWLYAEGTISVTPGTETYAVPTNYMRTLWIADDQNNALAFRQRRDAIRFFGTQATPRFYSIKNGLIYLSPVPSQAATYRHGYYTSLPLVTSLAGTDIAIPPIFQGLAALFIAKHMAMSLKDYNLYGAIQTEIIAERSRLMDNARRSLGPVAPQVRRAW